MIPQTFVEMPHPKKVGQTAMYDVRRLPPGLVEKAVQWQRTVATSEARDNVTQAARAVLEAKAPTQVTRAAQRAADAAAALEAAEQYADEREAAIWAAFMGAA